MDAQTRAIHGDNQIPINTTDVTPPIHLASTFRYPSDAQDLVAVGDRAAGHKDPHVYTRITSPGVDRVEAVLSQLLDGHAVAYSSGLSAAYALMSLLNPKTIAMTKEETGGYHGCLGVSKRIQRLSGMKQVTLEEIDHIKQGDVIWVETPLNPLGVAYDIQYFSTEAKKRGATLVVDATFGPPPLQDPFALGADFVMHSATKYLGGHSDVLGGVVVTKDESTAAQLRDDRTFFGTILAPQPCSLLLRSLRTYPLRIGQHSLNALHVVQFLNRVATDPDYAKSRDIEPGVLQRVVHTSLQKDEFVQKRMKGGHSPTFAIYFASSDLAKTFCSSKGGLKLFDHATSLGGAESLVEWRAMTDPLVDRKLVRISIGLEKAEDLVNDIAAALARISPK